MSWTKIAIDRDQANRLYRRHVPMRDADTASFMFIELEEWLVEWCKANCKDRVKIRTHLAYITDTGPMIGARKFKVKEIKFIYVKFKNPDDAIIFRLTL